MCQCWRYEEEYGQMPRHASKQVDCHIMKQEVKEWGTDGLPKSSDTASINDIHESFYVDVSRYYLFLKS